MRSVEHEDSIFMMKYDTSRKLVYNNGGTLILLLNI